MIQNIRSDEKTLSTKSGKFRDREKDFFNATRSVVSRRVIGRNEMLTKNNITTMRPALPSSIPATEYFNMIGKVAKRDTPTDSVLFLKNVE